LWAQPGNGLLDQGLSHERDQPFIDAAHSLGAAARQNEAGNLSVHSD